MSKSRLETRRLTRELIEQRRADVPGAEHADRQRLPREIERGVRGAQRPLRVAPVDDDRDVALRRTLRDRANVHAGLAQRAEELRRDSGLPGHPVADDRENAAVGRHVHRLNLPVMAFGEERVLDRGAARARQAHPERRNRSSARSCPARS